MGEARRRGDYEKRKAEAIQAGRVLTALLGIVGANRRKKASVTKTSPAA